MADDSKKQLPSGDDTSESSAEENPFSEYYQSAEQYEAYGSNIELQLQDLKRRISKDLKDEFARIEYELTLKERQLKLKEIELNQREQDLIAREKRIALLERQEMTPSPKTYGEEEESLEDIEFEQEVIEDSEKAAKRKESYEGGRNKEGIGGLPGSKMSNSIVIDRGVYQGDTVTLQNGHRLNWNKERKEYDFVFNEENDTDPAIIGNRGLKFTYFAVEAAYLNDGYDNPNYPHFYSQTLLRKQVWYERTPRNREPGPGNLGEVYQGRVPLEVLEKLLNDSLNTRLFTGQGQFIENQPYRSAYKNWRLKYERGTYYKTAQGELYSILERGSQVNVSKGNPPTYRTDGKLTSETYGRKVYTSTEERARWRSTGIGPKKGRKGKK